jgi:integrase
VSSSTSSTSLRSGTWGLKSVTKQWADEQESAITQGNFRDPRTGNITVGQWYARVAAARVIDPATRAKHARLPELGMTVGLRPGELYGLHGHRVNWLRGTLTVVDVMTRTGLRQWPKSEKSHRTVPVASAIMEGMSALMAGRPSDAPVFTASEGGPVDEGNFRDRIWYPAIEKSGCAGSHRRRCGTPLLPGW